MEIDCEKIDTQQQYNKTYYGKYKRISRKKAKGSNSIRSTSNNEKTHKSLVFSKKLYQGNSSIFSGYEDIFQIIEHDV
ncbi:MAG: hypothetical protein PHT72_01870 [Candidatus Absconditabacteria bacterium]|nr:hypothetical protein [Candidatus Absconditabacteria bacterium]